MIIEFSYATWNQETTLISLPKSDQAISKLSRPWISRPIEFRAVYLLCPRIRTLWLIIRCPHFVLSIRIWLSPLYYIKEEGFSFNVHYQFGFDHKFFLFKSSPLLFSCNHLLYLIIKTTYIHCPPFEVPFFSTKTPFLSNLYNLLCTPLLLFPLCATLLFLFFIKSIYFLMHKYLNYNVGISVLNTGYYVNYI